LKINLSRCLLSYLYTARVCVEVPWVPKTGSLRCIKKHSQARKGGYVPTADEDSGSYIYGSFGTDALEF
jgi:hypothetical protein